MRFAVLGDLHFDPSHPELFESGRRQILGCDPDAIVSLGDLGMYGECGTRRSFIDGRQFLASFGVPFETLIGNHDLESLDEFTTDAAAVEAFQEVFGLEQPYRCFELGDALGIVLSSTSFRAHRGFAHEVFIDDEQFSWFAATLDRQRSRPTFVFSHCPPLGSRLRVLQHLHLKFGNAWLNHSNDPRRFQKLIAEHPQIRLWFSGHFHLGQHYRNSVSKVGNCIFLHTGVMGNVTRDGARHSRLVAFDATNNEIQIDTFDHAQNQLIPDLHFDLAANSIERLRGGELRTEAEKGAPPDFDEIASEWQIGRSIFHVHDDMLIEYDRHLKDPVGIVESRMRGKSVRIDKDRLFVEQWWRSRQLEPNPDGYFFRTRSR